MEEVISLAGSSATEVVRALYAKIAGGAADYAEAMAVLCPDEGEGAVDDSIVRDGWSIADEFYSSIGHDVATAPVEERPWDEVYADAMARALSREGRHAMNLSGIRAPLDTPHRYRSNTACTVLSYSCHAKVSPRSGLRSSDMVR